ncbi:DUF2335 domain-containing protein [Nitrosomonas sp. Nm33]|uniref:DUF2335 domain-containing protein n=1 Tax=Nitrosomonas sp. Nm33 TaxID=133724 RepID=UPI0008952602|nr:DUF2335 domain-containing protein [Nitrosomonas sp. Nm33]SDY86339.1 Uncharacterized membrane protein [Nitrosomonas sp. Nm33]
MTTKRSPRKSEDKLISESSANNKLNKNSEQGNNEIDPAVEKFLQDNPKLGELVREHPEIKQTLTIEASAFSGPLPHPAILKQYDAIQPGFAERILVMAEKDADHIRSMQQKALAAKKQEVTLGQVFAVSIGIVALLCGAYVSVNSHPLYGTLLGGGSVIGLVTVFILGRSKSKEKSNNR